MRKQSLVFGLIGGLLFFAHAMINNSHAWPLVWPALAGLLTLWSQGRRPAASYAADITKAATAGLVAGAVFMIATGIALAQMGLLEKSGLFGLVSAAGLGLLVAVIAGALAHPVARRA